MKRWQVWLSAMSALTLFFFCMLFWAFMSISDWYREHEVLFHAPVEISFFEPIKIAKIQRTVVSPIADAVNSFQTKVSAAEPKAKTKEEIINSQPHAKQIMYVWDKETSKGRPSSDPTALHEKCKAKGMTNEFGFSPFDVTCFDTFEEAVEAIESWFEKEDKRALCRYNQGTADTDCPYAENWSAKN